MRKSYQTKEEFVKIFNEYISNIAPNLDIQRPSSITLHHEPVLNAIKKIENQPSIVEIKKTNSFWCSFPIFIRKVNLTEIINEIKNLDESKATQSNDIPTKVIKESYDIFATYITEDFNNMIESSVFPDSLKQACEHFAQPILDLWALLVYTDEQVLWPHFF